jgi:hypothetical protein
MWMTFLQHVPVWVFGLLALLIGLGVAQSFPRSVSMRRSAVLPIALMSVSLAGVVSTFGALAPALAAWAGGVGIALAALQGRVDVSAVSYSARHQVFKLPGSWAPLALMMGLFAVKFVAGAMLALQPSLATSMPFALGASASYGLFSGAFLGRAMALWSLARRSPQPVRPVAA